jgi:hypothetical protein
VGRILRKLRQLRSLNRGDMDVEGRSHVENTDAFAATGGRGAMDPQHGVTHPSAPPNWVKPDAGVPATEPRH